MIVLLAISLIAAFIFLVLASTLPAPAWIWALDGIALNVAVSALVATALLAARLRLPTPWNVLVLPGLSSLAAIGFQGWLMEWLFPSEVVARIDYWGLQFAALSFIGAVFAVIGSAVALGRAGTWYALVLGGTTMTVGLYVLGPLLLRVGVPFDHRTFLGLAAMGLGVYAMVEAARKVRRR